MLIKTFAATAALSLFGSAAALCAGVSYTDISGHQASALFLAYEALPQAARSNLSATNVSISSPIDNSADVSFMTPTSATVYRVNLNSQRATLIMAGRAQTSAIKLNGGDAKAVVLIYGEWLSGRLTGPDVSALRSGQFSIRETYVEDSGAAKLPPAYVVRYLPAGASWESLAIPSLRE